MSDNQKNIIDDKNLEALWTRVFEKVKLLTGSVNKSKGTLQEQVDKKSDEGHTHEDINKSIFSHVSNMSNPHKVSKADVGLGNVENKSSATIRDELTSGNVTKALGFTPINPTSKGGKNGIAELDDNGKVPSSQLPSFVDDVVEGYLFNGKFYKESAHTTEITGESSKIYIELSTEKTYRWSGSAFTIISETIALGETSSTAYRGDRGKIAYEHSQATHARTDATKVEASSTNGNIKINGKETPVYTHPSGTNPHGTTKTDLDLEKVGNYKAVSTEASQGLTDTEKANARANIGAGTSSFSGSYNDLSDKPTNLSFGQGYATCSTAESTTAKVGVLSSYNLVTGGVVVVKFTNAVPASATLNINSKGAKPIYYKGAAITTGIIKAGDMVTFMYNGTAYMLMSIDRWQSDLEQLNSNLNINYENIDSSDITVTGSVAFNDVSGEIYTIGKILHFYVYFDVANSNDDTWSFKFNNYHITKNNYKVFNSFRNTGEYIPSYSGIDGNIIMQAKTGNCDLYISGTSILSD